MSFAYTIDVDETLVHFVHTHGHILGIVHIVSLPVAKLTVGTRLVEVRRLTDDHLAHFIHEKTLLASQEAHDRMSLQPLPIYELPQVKLLLH